MLNHELPCSEAVQDDIQAWRRSYGLQPIGGGGKKRGPAIDPFSHGGYQGEHAPEWKPYRPPSAQQVSACNFAKGVLYKARSFEWCVSALRSVTRYLGRTSVDCMEVPLVLRLKQRCREGILKGCCCECGILVSKLAPACR